MASPYIKIPVKHTNIDVVGDGISGVFSALNLAREGYKVTLFAPAFMEGGPSRVARRIHRGGEYPLDVPTAVDCLYSAAIWSLIASSNQDKTLNPIFSQTRPMRFLTAQKTQDEGFFSFQQHIEHYKFLKRIYATIVADEKWNTMGMTREMVENRLLGPVEDFYTDVSAYDLKCYMGTMAGGFESQEQGILPSLLKKVLLQELNDAGVSIIHSPITNIEGELGNFKLQYEEDGKQTAHHADQVVVAAGERSFSLLEKYLDDEPPVHLYRRGILTADIRNRAGLPPSTFALLGDHGGMLHKDNEDTAICYNPKHAQLGTLILRPGAYAIPDDYYEIPHKGRILEDYVRKIIEIYPSLEGANFEMTVTGTMNWKMSTAERPNQPVKQARRGIYFANSTKFTHGPACGVAVTDLVQRTSRGEYKEHGMSTREAFDVVSSNYQKYKIHNEPTPMDMEIKSARDKRDSISFSGNRPLIAPSSFIERGFVDSPARMTLYTEAGPVTGKLFYSEDIQHNRQTCERIGQWVEEETDNPSITSFIKPEILAPALHNRLLHSDMDALAALSEIVSGPYPKATELLFGNMNLRRIAPDVLKLIVPFDNNEEITHEERVRLAQEKVRTGDRDIRGALLPALYGVLPEEWRDAVTENIAYALQNSGKQKQFFKPLADPDINYLDMVPASPAMFLGDIASNGKAALQVKPVAAATPPTVQFQGREYHFQEMIVHPFNQEEGEEPAFKIYRNPEQEKACREDMEEDPNKKAIGQVRLVYRTKGETQEKGREHVLWLCAHFQEGKPNQELGNCLESLQEPEPELSIKNANALLPKKVRPFEPENIFGPIGGEFRSKIPVPLATFNGHYIAHLAKPVDISAEQLEQMKQAIANIYRLRVSRRDPGSLSRGLQ